ncbi:MAG: hypothetical protein A2939_02355 [Parcubacteria group bacterium RIFCSPLOWO2_01_FULL_48_18]|nr:MAG: hypothetical protein A3J67_02430 [Parcubacteria group bacterium RIFCSPHIGHO2_02_FULL_48_10b]OHB23230.1 MAG: hypothetical protein A2939_02355 [Parcubacteria group bacterium RIFCSPLOWO2_01_FULL_48_18]
MDEKPPGPEEIQERNWDEEGKKARIEWHKKMLNNWPGAHPRVRKIWEDEIAKLEGEEKEKNERKDFPPETDLPQI